MLNDLLFSFLPFSLTRLFIEKEIFSSALWLLGPGLEVEWNGWGAGKEQEYNLGM